MGIEAPNIKSPQGLGDDLVGRVLVKIFVFMPFLGPAVQTLKIRWNPQAAPGGLFVVFPVILQVPLPNQSKHSMML